MLRELAYPRKRGEICLHIDSAYMSGSSHALEAGCLRFVKGPAPLGRGIHQEPDGSRVALGSDAASRATETSPGPDTNGLWDWPTGAPSLPDKLRRAPICVRPDRVLLFGPLPIFEKTAAGGTCTPAYRLQRRLSASAFDVHVTQS